MVRYRQCSVLRGSEALPRFPASFFRTPRRDWEVPGICTGTEAHISDISKSTNPKNAHVQLTVWRMLHRWLKGSLWCSVSLPNNCCTGMKWLCCTSSKITSRQNISWSDYHTFLYHWIKLSYQWKYLIFLAGSGLTFNKSKLTILQ